MCDIKAPQEALNIWVGLFDCVGLCTNTNKTQVVLFAPGKIRLPNAFYSYSHIGLEICDVQERNRVHGQKHDMKLSEASLQGHLGMQDDVYPSQEMLVEPDEEQIEWLFHTHTFIDRQMHCPVQECVSTVTTLWSTWGHFALCYPRGLISVLVKGEHPCCTQCCM